MPKPKTSVRKRQISELRKRQRKLVAGPWFKPVYRPEKMPAVKTNAEERRHYANLAKNNPATFDGSIRRIGKVKQGSTRKKAGVLIPTAETKFSKWYGARKGKNQQKRAVEMKKKRFKKAPYSIGANALIELVDKKGKPTYIMLIQRPRNVATGGPLHFDFAAGLTMAKTKPLDALKKKIREETGIPLSKMNVIGKGFKKSGKGEAFALHLKEKNANYDIVHVIRAGITPEEARRLFEKLENKKWKPPKIAIIERTPEAIRKFIRNEGKIWLPEVLRLYARELALYPGKNRKRK